MNQPLIPLHLQLLAAAVLITLLSVVVVLIRRHQLGLRDSLLWLLSTTAALALTLFPSTLEWLARTLEVAVPLNALFAVAFVYVLLNLLSATIAISSSAARLRRVAQECTILRGELEDLRARLDAERRGVEPPGRRW
jgi:hypothetical protein